MWIHLQSHFNELRQGQTGSDQTTVSGISEARQRRKQYRAGIRAGSNTVGISRSNITRAGSRESTEVNSPESYTGRSQNTGRTLRMSAGAKQEYQRQSRDVNNTRQGSRSQAQVQSSKVGQSRVKHRDIN